jgi:hypothetical protein
MRQGMLLVRRLGTGHERSGILMDANRTSTEMQLQWFSLFS